MSIIGDAPKLTIGFELYRPGVESTSKDEGELNVAKRLISDISGNYKRFINVVMYDALACNSVWINQCQDLGVDVIVRAKEKNITSLKQVKKKANKQDSIFIWRDEKEFERVKIYESTFQMRKGIVTTCMEMSLKTLFKMIRARWDIENSIFNNLKNKYDKK